jgi:hypothetical protein
VLALETIRIVRVPIDCLIFCLTGIIVVLLFAVGLSCRTTQCNVEPSTYNDKPMPDIGNGNNDRDDDTRWDAIDRAIAHMFDVEARSQGSCVRFLWFFARVLNSKFSTSMSIVIASFPRTHLLDVVDVVAPFAVHSVGASSVARRRVRPTVRQRHRVTVIIIIIIDIVAGRSVVCRCAERACARTPVALDDVDHR